MSRVPIVIAMALAILSSDALVPWPWPATADAADRRGQRAAVDRGYPGGAADDEPLGGHSCQISGKSPLHKNSRERGLIAAQIRTGVTHQQRALTFLQGDNPEQLMAAAEELCESYVLFRFARRAVNVPDNERAQKVARKKHLPTDAQAHKQLDDAMKRLREANRALWDHIKHPQAPGGERRLVRASEQLSTAMQLGQAVLRRF